MGGIRAFGQNLAAYFKTPEIVYSFSLIVLIPILITLNSILVINLFTTVVDAQARDKAAVSAELLKRSFPNPEPATIQSAIDEIRDSTNDANGDHYFQRLDYLTKKPNEESFILAASSDKGRVGKVIKPAADTTATGKEQAEDPRSFTQLNLSWTEQKDIAIAANENGKNGYQVSLLVKNQQTKARQGVISAFVSTAYIDHLLSQSYIRSAELLTLTVVIILLLLFIRSRIYRYSTLFKKLQEVDQMKDEFISVASHELRTPLTSIRGNLSMLLEEHDLDEAERAKVLSAAEKSSEQLTNLVADLLDVSRIEQGRVKVEPVVIELSPAISQVVEDLQQQAAAKKLTLSFVVPDEKLMVTTDKDKLRQILVNLIGNAIKYTVRGSVEVSVATEQDHVAVTVRDTGVGMSPEARANLFKKFYRIRTKETQNITGTGLGLWITKSLVELMGGAIYVDSIEGSGTQIKFTLPKA